MRICKVFSLLAVLLLGPVAASAGEGTIHFVLLALPPRFGNPYSTSAAPTITTTSAIYDGLTRHSRDGALKPWLATAWKNTDAKTWRFTLRDGVTFSNGKPFDAKAVAAAATYLATTTRAVDNLVRDIPRLVSARAVDAHTVEIVTQDPVPTLPRFMSVLFIPEPEAFEKLGVEEFSKTPVGTGPFKVEKWEANRALLKSFDGSWRKPKAAELELLELPDATARLQSVVSGRADIAIGLGPDDMQTLQAAGFKGISWNDGGVVGLSLVNTRNLPFNDVRVRQAMSMAVNRQPIVDVIMQGQTVVANQPAARGVYGYDAEIPMYPYDPARAKKLLAEAGYPDGFKFTLETAAITGAGLATYQQVAADLAKIGIQMEIRPVQLPQYLANVFLTGNYADALPLPWLPTPSLDIMRTITLHSCASKFAWYCDKDAEPMIAQAAAEWDETKALQERRALSRRYHDQAAALFLYEQVFFAGLGKRTSGYADDYGLVSYDQISVTGK